MGIDLVGPATPAASVQCPAGCAAASRDVWGTGVYTADSPVCKAAIHAGLITNTSGGVVTVYWDSGRELYAGGWAGQRSVAGTEHTTAGGRALPIHMGCNRWHQRRVLGREGASGRPPAARHLALHRPFHTRTHT